MKRIKHANTIAAMLLLSVTAFSAQAELKNGDVLDFGAGSKISIEASKGFWMDVPVKGNRGLVIGTTQAGKSIDGPFYLFGTKSHHVSTGPINAVNATELDFSSWAMQLGETLVNLGEGVAKIQCDRNCSKGEAFTLEYSVTLPDEAGALAGLPYKLHLTGKIK